MREFCRRARCPALRQARDPMPLGFEDPQESNFHLQLIVPEGYLRIAQGFNLGYGVIERIESRRGRLNCWSTLNRPFGTRGPEGVKPKVETLGYSQMSLRDRAVG